MKMDNSELTLTQWKSRLNHVRWGIANSLRAEGIFSKEEKDSRVAIWIKNNPAPSDDNSSEYSPRVRAMGGIAKVTLSDILSLDLPYIVKNDDGSDSDVVIYDEDISKLNCLIDDMTRVRKEIAEKKALEVERERKRNVTLKNIADIFGETSEVYRQALIASDVLVDDKNDDLKSATS